MVVYTSFESSGKGFGFPQPIFNQTPASPCLLISKAKHEVKCQASHLSKKLHCSSASSAMACIFSMVSVVSPRTVEELIQTFVCLWWVAYQLPPANVKFYTVSIIKLLGMILCAKRQHHCLSARHQPKATQLEILCRKLQTKHCLFIASEVCAASPSKHTQQSKFIGTGQPNF